MMHSMHKHKLSLGGNSLPVTQETKILDLGLALTSCLTKARTH